MYSTDMSAIICTHDFQQIMSGKYIILAVIYPLDLLASFTVMKTGIILCIS